MKKAAKKITYEFRFIPVLVYFMLLIALVSLGIWQLGRADEKEIFLSKESNSAAKKTIKFVSDLDADMETIRYRKIELTGQYAPKKQYLIDNQIINGKVGYFVLTPFKINNTNKVVLVNRGWVALNKDRRVLPDITMTSIKATISGTINNFPSVGIRLTGADIPTAGWPSVVQVVNTEILSKKSGYSILPYQIELDTENKNGYIRDWKKRTSITPEKHIAYAVQWFGLAITLTILFIRLNRKCHDRTT